MISKGLPSPPIEYQVPHIQTKKGKVRKAKKGKVAVPENIVKISVCKTTEYQLNIEKKV